MNKEFNILSISFGLVIILIVGLGFSSYSSLSKKIDSLKLEVNATLSEADSKLSALSNKLAADNENRNRQFAEIKEESQKTAKLAKEIEEQSANQLEKVKKDLETVSSASDFSSVTAKTLPSIVSVITDRSQGSGAIISNEGHIITTEHLITGTRDIKILTHDNKTYPATIIAQTPINDISLYKDIAILKIGTGNVTYPFLSFADSSQVKVGEKILALGSPYGLDFTVTQGIVSAVDREIDDIEYKFDYKFIQVDAALNPGNSGGPVINKNGEIIGMTNLKLGWSEGLSFAIPSNVLREYKNKFI